MIKLIVGKKGKTVECLKEFLDNDNSYYFSESISFNGIKGVSKRFLEKDLTEEHESRFFFLVTDFNLTKINNLVLTKKIRNTTVILDGNILDKHTMKEIKHFGFMNNLQIIIALKSFNEDELVTVTI
jgi:hypothetical protein